MVRFEQVLEQVLIIIQPIGEVVIPSFKTWKTYNIFFINEIWVAYYIH